MTTDDSAPRRREVRPAVPAADPTGPPSQPADQAAERTPTTGRAAAPDHDTGSTGQDLEPRSQTTLQWRVPGGTTVLKALGAAGFLAAGLLFARDTAGIVVAVAAAALVGLYALRDLLAPVRLSADGDGVMVVTGFAGIRRIPWRNVERIRVDERSRLGVRSALLEIDTGSSLHLFGATELGAPVEDVAEELRHLRTGR